MSSIPRYRHSYTLATKRQPHSDVFEKDPFKIQSYKFHYAERPPFPMPAFSLGTQHLEDCRTHFHNKRFRKTNDLNAPGNSKFHEHRRRKFLSQTGSYRTLEPVQLLQKRSSVNNDTYTSQLISPTSPNMLASASSLKHSVINSISRTVTPSKVQSDIKPECSTRSIPRILPLSASGFIPKEGGEINININGLSKSLHENVNIEIKSDSMYKNLNIPLHKLLINKSSKSSSRCSLRVSDTFSMTKRLAQRTDRQSNEFRRSLKERQGDVASIYSTSKLNKPHKILQSKERLPTLIPYHNNTTLSKTNLASKRSLLQRVRSSISAYAKKPTRKSSSCNSLSHKSLEPGFGRVEIFKSLRKPQCPVRSPNFLEKPPLKININLFAEK